MENLHIKVFADASLGTIEENLETKSIMGSFISLSNDESSINPLNWRSKVIDKVAPDTKTAETLALKAAIVDAIYLSKMLTEIYTGNIDDKQIPLIVYEDSKSLVQSLYSTKNWHSNSPTLQPWQFCLIIFRNFHA